MQWTQELAGGGGLVILAPERERLERGFGCADSYLALVLKHRLEYCDMGRIGLFKPTERFTSGQQVEDAAHRDDRDPREMFGKSR